MGSPDNENLADELARVPAGQEAFYLAVVALRSEPMLKQRLILARWAMILGAVHTIAGSAALVLDVTPAWNASGVLGVGMILIGASLHMSTNMKVISEDFGKVRRLIAHAPDPSPTTGQE